MPKTNGWVQGGIMPNTPQVANAGINYRHAPVRVIGWLAPAVTAGALCTAAGSRHSAVAELPTAALLWEPTCQPCTATAWVHACCGLHMHAVSDMAYPFGKAALTQYWMQVR
jgi:hypothetical protein